MLYLFKSRSITCQYQIGLMDVVWRRTRRKKRITIYLRPAGRELGETVCAARQLPGGTFFAAHAIIFLRNKNFVLIAFLLAKF